MPTYVLDIPGGHGKAPLGPQWIRTGQSGSHALTDWRGIEHPYVDRLDPGAGEPGRVVRLGRPGGAVSRAAGGTHIVSITMEYLTD